MPAPSDTPDVVKRAVSLPEHMLGSAVLWLSVSEAEDEIVLIQQCSSEGVLYSDRFYVQYTYGFKVDPSGGLNMRLWVETVWTRPLPWTHSFLARFLEKKV